MPQTYHTQILVIGGGPAGYTAAIYAARANRQPMLVQGPQPGGQLTVTTEVENFPGFANPIQGPWLMEQMEAQAKHVGTQLIYDIIAQIDLNQRPFKAVGDSGDIYLADSVIIATGAQARWLGLPSETLFRGFGVSGCATCDGFFYKGKRVAVIGGGNTAVEEALFLSGLAAEVVLIHRRDSLRAEKVLQQRLLEKPNVTVLWNHEVVEVLGTRKADGQAEAVTGLKLQDVNSQASHEIAADGVFVAIGHDPATSLFKGQLETDAHGYLLTKPDSTLTSIPGVFAAGDVKDKVYRQAVTAAGLGCMAALDAERWLNDQPSVAKAA
ncbi:MAG: thioredoxin-disulfide reductase [Holosporaceae bacterium]|jgi:thioredoxin reductase (NADPH)|nr:thioredoxin-disulfide reductase [Rhodospirillaceae bacterium]